VVVKSRIVVWGQGAPRLFSLERLRYRASNLPEDPVATLAARELGELRELFAGEAQPALSAHNSRAGVAGVEVFGRFLGRLSYVSQRAPTVEAATRESGTARYPGVGHLSGYFLICGVPGLVLFQKEFTQSLKSRSLSGQGRGRLVSRSGSGRVSRREQKAPRIDGRSLVKFPR